MDAYKKIYFSQAILLWKVFITSLLCYHKNLLFQSFEKLLLIVDAFDLCIQAKCKEGAV